MGLLKKKKEEVKRVSFDGQEEYEEQTVPMAPVPRQRRVAPTPQIPEIPDKYASRSVATSTEEMIIDNTNGEQITTTSLLIRIANRLEEIED